MKQRHAFLLAALVVAASCNSEITGLEPPSDPATETFAASLGVDIASMSKTPNGVYFQDVVVGSGDEVLTTTDSVVFTYAGYLKDGKLFESGNGVVADPDDLIAGFREGLLGMKEGGKRKLVIPSELGYGRETQRDLDGNITIPRQSTLIFDVEVTTVYNPAPPPEPES